MTSDTQISERPDGVTLVAVYYVFVGAMGLLGACVILTVALFPVALNVDEGDALFWALFGLCIGFVVTGGSGILSVLAGWGLLNLKEWARWLALVLAVFTLFAFPIGTIIGVLIIWYLLQDEAKDAFLTASS
jgi:hypothetical protein